MSSGFDVTGVERSAHSKRSGHVTNWESGVFVSSDWARTAPDAAIPKEREVKMTENFITKTSLDGLLIVASFYD